VTPLVVHEPRGWNKSPFLHDFTLVSCSKSSSPNPPIRGIAWDPWLPFCELSVTVSFRLSFRKVVSFYFLDIKIRFTIWDATYSMSEDNVWTIASWPKLTKLNWPSLTCFPLSNSFRRHWRYEAQRISCLHVSVRERGLGVRPRLNTGAVCAAQCQWAHAACGAIYKC